MKIAMSKKETDTSLGGSSDHEAMTSLNAAHKLIFNLFLSNLEQAGLVTIRSQPTTIEM